MATVDELAAGWIRALADVELFYELTAQDCRVWHSNDNEWMSVKQAVDNVHLRGGLPVFEDARYSLTAKGFFVQASAFLEGPQIKVHILQNVQVADGLAVQVEEYVGPEMEVAV